MMSNEPPQGAHSADPVREAAQALIDATDTIVPEHLTANEAMDWCEIDNAKVDAAWDALRTALAALGPAPTHEVARKDGSMTFEEAQDLARKHAKAEPESYYAEPFEPHLWVINAIVEASARWYQRAVDERVRRVKEANSRAPEAPPPVEARQPLTAEAWVHPADERAAFEKWCKSDEGGWWDEALERVGDGYHAKAVNKEWRGWQARAALDAPAGAIQPPLDHQVGAPVTPLPLDSASGAPRATAMEFEDIPACPGCGAMAGCCNDYPNCPGTVYVPIFFPRWRVRFVFYAKHWDDGTSGPKLCYGIWHRTQEEAERHAIRFLDGGFPSPGVDSDLYDIERQQ